MRPANDNRPQPRLARLLGAVHDDGRAFAPLAVATLIAYPPGQPGRSLGDGDWPNDPREP